MSSYYTDASHSFARSSLQRAVTDSLALPDTEHPFHPRPLASGELRVDPEIHLPSPGMDVDIAYYYNSNTPYNGPYGYGRTLDLNLTAQASGAPLIVTMTRGNGTVVTYQHDGGTFMPQTPGLLNTLERDTADNLWKETTPDGQLSVYPLDTTGTVTSISSVQDAVGNRHTFSYASGLLQTLEDAVGRKVSFSYEGNGLLEEIADWAGRRTTFQYDTTSVSGQPLLTTVIGRSGSSSLATSFVYDGVGNRLTQNKDEVLTTYTYDAANQMLSATTPESVTTYAYDGAGNRVSEVTV